MSIYYQDDLVTLYHGSTRNEDMIECNTWHSLQPSGRLDTERASAAKTSPRYHANAATSRRLSTSRSGSALARTITRGRGATCLRRADVSAHCVCTQTRGHVRSVAPPGRNATTSTATPRTTSPGISPSCVAVATCEKTGA